MSILFIYVSFSTEKQSQRRKSLDGLHTAAVAAAATDDDDDKNFSCCGV